MVADWSAECSHDDSVLVIPWSDPEGDARFIDLRTDPYDLYLIREAQEHPALQQALRSLNASRSPVFTAKCDVWQADAGELDELRAGIDAEEGLAQAAMVSYLDVLWRDRGIFASRHRQEQMLDRLVRRMSAFDAPLGLVECVLRPAVIDLDETREGYAVSLYVKAAGSDGTHAEQEWARSLSELVRVLRTGEFSAR